MAKHNSGIVVRGLDEMLSRRVRADAALRGQQLTEWLEQACLDRLAASSFTTEIDPKVLPMRRQLDPSE